MNADIIIEIVKAISESPLYVILIVSGIVFVFFSIIGFVPVQDTKPLNRFSRGLLALFGVALAVISVILAASTLPPSVAEQQTQVQVPTQEPTDIPRGATPEPIDLATPVPSTGVPLRSHQVAALGTGVFERVTFSDGMAEISESSIGTNYINAHRIRREENASGCATALFNASQLWFSGSLGTEFTINGEVVGRLERSTGSHGHIVDVSISIGDQLCAVGYDASGYQMLYGPDLYYHYDSYCYRGFCGSRSQ